MSGVNCITKLDYSPRPFSNMRYEINEAADNGYIEARHLTDDELEKVLNLEGYSQKISDFLCCRSVDRSAKDVRGDEYIFIH